MPLKMLKHDNNEEKRSKTLKLFTHVIQTYHKKPYPNVVKKIFYCSEFEINNCKSLQGG